MNNNENLDRDAADTFDEDTVELVTLELEDALLPAGDEAAPADAEAVEPQSARYLWLKHMEGELDRLQSRWAEIDVELGARDSRIAELTAEVEKGEAARAELAAKLEEKAAAAAALETELASLRAVIAEQDAAVAAKESQIETSAKEFERRLVEAVEGRNALLGRIQDLELYIDGRQKDWSQRSAELAKHRTEIAELERARNGLEEKVLDLERQCAELVERRRERDEAYRAIEEKLAAEIEVAGELRAELEQRAAESEKALAEAAAASRAAEAKGADLEARDKELAEARAAVAAAEDRICVLERESAALGEGAENARNELAAERAETRRLRAELDERRATLHLLDRNIERMNVLGTRLKRIDRRESTEALLGEARAESNVHYLGTADGRPSPQRRMLVGVGQRANLSFPLQKQNTTIGRSHRSDIRINGQFVSRIHARVLTHPGGTIIEDLGSKNGVFVNSEPITRCVLKDGDVVSLGGKLDLKYVELDA